MDYKNLDPELIKKLTALEKKKPEWQSLQALHDIADISQELLNVIDSTKTQSDKQIGNLGTLLVDAREQLIALNDKMAQDVGKEAPDFATPVIAAVTKLEDAIRGLDLKPRITLPAPIVDLKVPDVNVTTPTIDTSVIEKLLRDTLPKAFNDAIASIPQPQDDTAVITKLDELGQKLTEIDTGVRMKPAAPNQVKVINPDTSPTGNAMGLGTHDFIGVTSAATSDIYAFKLGGSGGSLINTITIDYTDATKATILDIVKT